MSLWFLLALVNSSVFLLTTKGDKRQIKILQIFIAISFLKNVSYTSHYLLLLLCQTSLMKFPNFGQLAQALP